MPETRPVLGFIGLGAMGGPMARNLQRAGYRVVVFDVRPEPRAACSAAGCIAAADEMAVVEAAEIVMTSLPSSAAFVAVAEAQLEPNARPGQVFADLGTTAVAETRRLGAALAARGASLVDAPVSGGPRGAEQARLHVFVGGAAEPVSRVLPVLRVLGEPERVVWCGASGAGQLVKGVNQLAMGLGAAACLEAIAYAARAGVEMTPILQAMDGQEPWRRQFAAVARQVVEGRADTVDTKFAELHLFLEEAHAQGRALPLTEALYECCRNQECRFRDSMNRPTPSLWGALAVPGPRGDRADGGGTDVGRPRSTGAAALSPDPGTDRAMQARGSDREDATPESTQERSAP